MQTSVTFTNKKSDTIWNKLAARLGREPSDAEAKEEVRRLLREVAADRQGRH